MPGGKKRIRRIWLLSVFDVTNLDFRSQLLRNLSIFFRQGASLLILFSVELNGVLVY